MMRYRLRIFLSVLIVIASTVVPSAQPSVLPGRIGDIQLVSSTTTGKPANNISYAWFGSWSPDASRILFDSQASNLVPGATGKQVYVKDLRTGAVKLVSSTTTGQPGNSDSLFDGWSPDGSRVLFGSLASNLVPGATGAQVYVKDLRSGTVALVSSTRTGEPGTSDSSFGGWSPDGSRAAFISTASNLVPGATGKQVYVKDLRTGAVKLVSSTTTGEPANSDFLTSFDGWSPDGSRVAFGSSASNLVPGAKGYQAYVKDLRTGAVTLVNSTRTGKAGDSESLTFFDCWSPDGSRVAFGSSASNLVPGVKGGQVYVKDLRSGAVTLVSSTTIGQPANPGSYPVFLGWSPDGSRVAFGSIAPNPVPGDTGGHVYVKDLRTGAVTLVDSTRTRGPGNSAYWFGGWSPDGSRVAFGSSASNLMSRATGYRNQVYVKDLRTGAITLVSSTTTGKPGNAESSFFGGGWSPDDSRVAFNSDASNLVPGATGMQAYVKVVGK